MRRFLSAILIALVATTGNVVGQVETQITCDFEFPMRELTASAGWTWFTVKIRNDGRLPDRVSMSTDSWASFELRHAIDLGPGEEVVLEIPVPVDAGYFGVTVESGRDGYVAHESINLLASRSAPLTDLRAWVMIDPRDDAPSVLNVFSAGTAVLALRPGQMPNDWTGLTACDLILIDGEVLTALDLPQRNTLSRYIEVGGVLVVWDVAADDRSAIGAALASLEDSKTEWHRLGLGHVALRADDLMEESGVKTFDAWIKLQAPERVLAAKRFGVFTEFSMPMATVNPTWHPYFARPLTIPGIEPPAIQTFAIVVLVFAVVAGPFNFWWLSRRRRRTLAIVTIPVISTGALLIMVGYAVFAEGLDVDVMPRTITWLDCVDHRAATVAKPGFYAGMTPAGGLRPAVDTAVLTVAHDVQKWGIYYHTRHSRNQRRHRVDLQNGKSFRGEYIPARTPVEHVFLQAGRCRERLTFGVRQGDVVSVTNGLRTELRGLLFRLKDGTLFGIDRLAAGATGDARLAEGTVLDVLMRQVDGRLLDSWPERGIDPFADLSPESFAAVTVDPVFFDPGLEAPQWLPGINFLRGVFAEGSER